MAWAAAGFLFLNELDYRLPITVVDVRNSWEGVTECIVKLLGPSQWCEQEVFSVRSMLYCNRGGGAGIVP